MRIPLNLVKAALVSNLVVPHGLTDVLHGFRYNETQLLGKVHGLTSIFTCICHATNKDLLNKLMLFTSVLHFRRDFGMKEEIPRLVVSLIVVLGFVFTKNYDLYLLFMLLCHIPNHIHREWSTILHNKVASVLLFAGFRIVTGDSVFDLNSPNAFSLGLQCLILSHVLYGEINYKVISKARSPSS